MRYERLSESGATVLKERPMLKFFTKILLKNLSPSSARPRTTFGDEAPCKTTIYNWFAEFKGGCVNLSDEFRDGRPSTL
ncbi:hypothetical protein EVAR_67518_1 [Eumeta japonica]|uniref:Mos1 transposase HTH domain-containing protein n=1 Tax=Eumeta variegata TaxID=151549 RepID=A0A4C1YXQ2_EUMVA|nr:hypothetical protein EVAR_67518_1 [Eumeta japonica]